MLLYHRRTPASVHVWYLWTSTHYRKEDNMYQVEGTEQRSERLFFPCAANDNSLYQLLYHHYANDHTQPIAAFFSSRNNKRVIDDHRGNATNSLIRGILGKARRCKPKAQPRTCEQRCRSKTSNLKPALLRRSPLNTCCSHTNRMSNDARIQTRA